MSLSSESKISDRDTKIRSCLVFKVWRVSSNSSETKASIKFFWIYSGPKLYCKSWCSEEYHLNFYLLFWSLNFSVKLSGPTLFLVVGPTWYSNFFFGEEEMESINFLHCLFLLFIFSISLFICICLIHQILMQNFTQWLWFLWWWSLSLSEFWLICFAVVAFGVQKFINCTFRRQVLKVFSVFHGDDLEFLSDYASALPTFCLQTFGWCNFATCLYFQIFFVILF